MEFKEGDIVQFTAEAERMNPNARSSVGKVVNAHPNRSGYIRVRRLGLKTIEYWMPQAWELVPSEDVAVLTFWDTL